MNKTICYEDNNIINENSIQSAKSTLCRCGLQIKLNKEIIKNTELNQLLISLKKENNELKKENSSLKDKIMYSIID